VDTRPCPHHAAHEPLQFDGDPTEAQSACAELVCPLKLTRQLELRDASMRTRSFQRRETALTAFSCALLTGRHVNVDLAASRIAHEINT